MDKTIVIGNYPKSSTMTKKVEEKSNEKLGMGHVLVTMSIPNTAKTILVFKKTA